VSVRRGLRFLLLLAGSVAIAAAPSQLRAPRIAAHPDAGYTRVVLDAPGAPKYSLSLPASRQIALTVKGASASAVSGTAATGEVTSWKLTPKGADAVLTIGTSFNLARDKGYRAFTLGAADGAPDRIVIDVGPKPVASGTVKAPVKATPVSVASSHAPKRAAPIVVLDAGHGGKFPGTYSGHTGALEKAITLDVARRAEAILKAAGVKVVMTRDGDEHLSEEIRRDLQTRADKASTDKALFLSIHVNSTPDAVTSASGVETYYFGETMDAATLAQAERENGGGAVGKEITRYAQSVRRDLLREMSASTNLQFSQAAASKVLYGILGRTGAANRGVKQASFLVIAKARIPAILVEIGFANNPVEGKKLNTTAYRQAIAQGLTDGVLKFLGIEG
jgi:N-acetylmuramoyl-L-alanine amidase